MKGLNCFNVNRRVLNLLIVFLRNY